MTKFEDFFREAEREIRILGTNSLIPDLEESSKFFFDLLNLHRGMKLSIYYESDNENFNQSLCIDTDSSVNRISYSTLSLHRDRIRGLTAQSGIKAAILRLFDTPEEKKEADKRIEVKQVNLRLPVNVLVIDSRVFSCFVTHKLPTIESYREVTDEGLKQDLLEYIDFYTQPSKGGVYLSKPNEELIQLYDKSSFPRGIFPRASFYTTEFKRRSFWGFVFNRKGQLLLHQRSQQTKDNRGLWDKSIGGHVDIRDSSSYITAKRELVEEMFLPEDEHTKFMRADLGDLINFGDWNLRKRGENNFRSSFASLSPSDWILFSAVDEEGDPLSVSRVSERRFHLDDNKIKFRKTIFMSDIFMFIAPEGYLDDEEQMKELVKLSEKTGAAADHKLVSIEELRRWINTEEEENQEKTIFTDDLLYINVELRPLLERFSEFVRHIFNQ